jgi:hypothetical protein
MYSTPFDLSFSYLRSAVEAFLDIKKVRMEPNIVDQASINVSGIGKKNIFYSQESMTFFEHLN